MPTDGYEDLAHYLSVWKLEPDGTPFQTRHSWLLPVRHYGERGMLKIRKPASDECATASILAHYRGDGAVRAVLGHGPAVMMERACGSRSLFAMATKGEDEAAAIILADVAARLHVPRTGRPKGLTPLTDWFQPLLEHGTQSVQLARAASIARALLAGPMVEGVLHGDLHHDNVVHDTVRGWLAIDPKGLWGERTYDVANLLRNPWPRGDIVHHGDRLLRLASLYADRLGMDPRRILRFTLAHAGLSACWSFEDKADPDFDLRLIDAILPLLDA